MSDNCQATATGMRKDDLRRLDLFVDGMKPIENVVHTEARSHRATEQKCICGIQRAAELVLVSLRDSVRNLIRRVGQPSQPIFPSSHSLNGRRKFFARLRQV